jgi:hypothetical protein
LRRARLLPRRLGMIKTLGEPVFYKTVLDRRLPHSLR